MNTAVSLDILYITMQRQKQDETTIVKRILAGDERALRVFYKSFSHPLARYISQKIGNREDAEEVLQDTLLGAIESFRDFQFRATLFTFLCSIANHKVIDYYRKKRLKTVLFSQLPQVESILARLLDPASEFDDELLRGNIQSTFEKLRPAYERILKLKYVHGYSVEEIARKLSISFKSAESKLFRARRAFVMLYYHV